MEEQIRNRAYQLWQEAGSPEGDGVDFWLRAESEVFPPVIKIEEFEVLSFILVGNNMVQEEVKWRNTDEVIKSKIK